MSLLDPPKADAGWTTLNAPEFVRFEKPGQNFAGILMEVNRVTIDQKSVVQYLFARDHLRFKVLGTFDLVQKLNRGHVGCMVRITYLGEDDKVTKGENRMRVFDVQVKGTPANQPSGDEVPITDQDIPW